jgi:Domain of unknown function (DUF4326)
MSDPVPPAPRRLRFNRYEGNPLPAGSRLVMRPSAFGNPFPAKGRGIAEAVRLYGEWLNAPEQSALRERVRRELKGLNLACSCPLGGPCHAELLLALANDTTGEEDIP